MLTDVLEGSRMFSVAMRKSGSGREIPSNVAGVGLVRAAVRNKDGTANLILQGITRVELEPRARGPRGRRPTGLRAQVKCSGTGQKNQGQQQQHGAPRSHDPLCHKSKAGHRATGWAVRLAFAVSNRLSGRLWRSPTCRAPP